MRPWAYNQGFYNLFLAIGTAAGIGLTAGGNHESGLALVTFCCGSMVAAALVLLSSDPRQGPGRGRAGRDARDCPALVAGAAAGGVAGRSGVAARGWLRLQTPHLRRCGGPCGRDRANPEQYQDNCCITGTPAPHHPHTRHHGPVLSSLAPARRRLVLALLALVVLAAVVAIAAVAVRQMRGEAVADQARPGPVVLVPGYGGAVSDLDPLVAEVRREGRTAGVLPAQRRRHR